MCVIICCENEFPALATLESAESMNRDGGGVAWIENGKVRYRKGLNSKQIFDLTKIIKLPAIIHFRIASIGAVVEELCHPFPINTEADTDSYGEGDSVLFHNGTWSEWQEVCLRTITTKDIPFPSGKWSDSRAMAWLADKYGTNVLRLIPAGNKIAVLSPTGIRKFGSFVEVEKCDCSNDYFDSSFSWGNDDDDDVKNVVTYHKGNRVPVKLAKKKDKHKTKVKVIHVKKLSKKERKRLRRMDRNNRDNFIRTENSSDGSFSIEADREVTETPLRNQAREMAESGFSYQDYPEEYYRNRNNMKDEDVKAQARAIQDEIDHDREIIAQRYAEKTDRERRGNSGMYR